MGANPTISQVEDGREGEQPGQQYGSPSQPPLHKPEAAPEEVARQDHRSGPYCTTEGVVEDEGPPAHPAYARDQGAEHPQAGEEARKEYGLATVPLEERFGAGQPLRGDEDIAAPPQDERAPPLAPEPVADLVPDDGPKDAEHDGIPQVEVPALDQDARG